MKKIFLFTPLISLVVISASSAAITAFSDRSLFESALNSLPGSYERHDEDLNAFISDTSFHETTALALDGFSIEGFGATPTTANAVDVSPFIASGKQEVDGSPYIRGQHQVSGAAKNYEITFPKEIFAWGSDVDDVEAGSTSLLLSSGESLDLSNGFTGFISDVGITSLQSSGGGTGDTVGLDNITLVAVPEAKHAALVLGLSALTLCGWTRRKVCASAHRR